MPINVMRHRDEKWIYQQVLLHLHDYKRVQHDSVLALSAFGLVVFFLRRSWRGKSRIPQRIPSDRS